MATQFERKHVSKKIPTDHRILMPLLLAVTIVNSAGELPRTTSGNRHKSIEEHTNTLPDPGL